MTKIERRKERYARSSPGRWPALINISLQFIPLFIFWLVLSGKFQPYYLVVGILSCSIIVWFNREMFSSLKPTDHSGNLSVRSALKTAWRLMIYIPWLAFQIARDNILVAYLVTHPKMPIDPRVVKFNSRYKRPASQVILANSITLSPGTMTVFLQDNEFVVHMLIPSSCDKLKSGELINRAGKIFDESPQEPPEIIWRESFEQLP